MNIEEFLTLAAKRGSLRSVYCSRASIDDESKWSDASHQ